ncbi:FAD-binding monooxygenase, PheA/TfdB family, similarity to 2,4-dichlorophenol 6-monooxygenase [Minicystis rosea]|nr:FAD-binding monooxygenase, PheA/TfdB family, similarity to 2,4-dichlorophenol 6-monooxygenase [Minicystis rosea]
MDHEAVEGAQRVPVLIVGGGVVGLSAALFLRRHGVETALVERHVGTSIHPRARGVNARTMELYRGLGLEEAIVAAGAATPIHLGFLFGASLGEAIDAPVGKAVRRVLRRLFGRNISFNAASPAHGCRITQDLLEPVLAGAARARGARLDFSTEMISFHQDDEGVEATLRDRRTEAVRKVKAQYLIAADGARSPVREALGITTSGRGSLGHLLNVLFEADLAEFVRDREFSLAIIHRKEVRGLFAAIDNRSRWVFHIVYDPARESPKDYPPERCAALVKAALGAGDVPIRITSVLPWESAARVADVYRKGRVFLAGDAAHLMPPWGGMGANTGIADAHDLTWKLAHVLRGEAEPELLDTYEAERRPVGVIASEDSADNADEQGLMARAALSKILGLSRAAIWARVTGRASPRPGRLVKLVGVGYQYASSAVSAEPEARRFALDGRPGTRLPHAWIRRGGERVSSIDLVGTRFTLIAGQDAEAWCDAARTAAGELGTGIDVVRAGVDFADPRGRFPRSAGITASGALLVRPDAVVAWRAYAATASPLPEIRSAMARALGR